MDKRAVQHVIKLYDIRPTRGKGQNFLLDDEVTARMVAAANVTSEDAVLEIGPGLGVLTRQLAAKAGKVVAVELDKNVAIFFKSEFGTAKNISLIEGDILAIQNKDLAKALGSQQYKVVANIPYAITAPLIQKFLTFVPRPTVLVLMVQKEVAERITAKPGEMSVLALSVQYFADAEILEQVPRAKFFPSPEVDSAVIRITPHLTNNAKAGATNTRITNNESTNNTDLEKNFFRTVKIGFSAKRKQLHNNLSAGFHITAAQGKEILLRLGLREDVRAQDLSLDDWKNLAEILTKL